MPRREIEKLQVKRLQATLVEPGRIERSTGKAKRVLDMRR
jgi:phenylacetate-coenzyme A ligase PaaK-like adenylate-forming protein